MPLPFSLPSRPSLPSLSWSTSSDSSSPTKSDEKGPLSAPPRTSQSSFASAARRLSSSRSIKHTSITVSRPTTPANPSPASAGFGLPITEDDDPFGVLALQKAGLHIKEAGTNNRPGSEAFQYRPAPGSPIWRSSMASAIGRTSRPSMDGRSSFMTGRSHAHSRQGSSVTVGTNDMSTQTDLDSTESTSLRGISPVRNLTKSRQSSPDSITKRSLADDSQHQRLRSPKPDSLISRDGDQKRRDETPSPRSKLAVVDEDTQEDNTKKDEPEVETRTTQTDKTESDLDALARELRAMADGHETEVKRNHEPNANHVNSAAADAEAVSATEEDSEDAKTPQRLSVRTSARPVSVRVQKRASRIGSTHQSIGSSKDNQEEEDDDDDEDGYDSFDDEEEPVIIEEAVQTAAPISLRPRHLGTASMQARAQIVSVHLPPPPKVPSRNPRRTRQFEASETSSDTSTEIQEDDNEHPQSPSSQGDSTSSYSLDHDRDSFDDHHEIMTQTSQGSDAGSTEVTPTRAKTFDLSPKLDFSDDSEPKSEDHGVETERPAAAGGETGKAERQHGSDLSTAAESNVSNHATIDLLKPTKPTVPERRRPFSFEAGADEEASDERSLDAVMSDSKPVEKKPEHAADTKHTTPEPIKIPSLPEDDGSIYEEDFS